MAACRSCGKENEPDARFCSGCGSTLVQETPPREVRKTVTVIFCDVTGSTALGERLDPEATRKLMSRYFETARAILERHGASVEKFIGDAVMAVFGVPQVHEDDALRATRAAVELRDSVTEVSLRIGVNTGEVVAGTGETLVTGDAVNVAARLEQAAEPGTILIGEQTYRLVRDAVEAVPTEPIEAKGKAERLSAYRLTNVVEGAAPFARRLDSPLVGREEELAQLEQAYARAVRDSSCHLFTLLGVPGIGKSRLCQEFLARLGDEATVVSGHCLSYGDGITYWPLVEILRDLGDATRIVQLLEGEPDARPIVNDVFVGVGLSTGAARPEETGRAVRKLFEALAREQPLVVLLDDLQWAEPTFLDLVEHVADLSREAPILLLCPARPDLLDVRPGWGGGKHNATTLTLEPLSDEEAETLIANLLAGSALNAALRERISSTSEGNPLFVEQMLAMLSDGTGEGEVLVPPTIHALLAARLDRLGRDERELLERASIAGKEFWRRAVVDLGAEPTVLEALVRKELIRPHRSTAFASDDAYRFRHQLIRDATYEAIPKELRAELHERFAEWLEGHLSEFDEIVGYHLEQTYRYRAELAEPDEQARALGERAGRLLGAAGVRAAERADVPAAIELLTRAVDLLPPSEERRIELQLDLGHALFDAGAREEANRVFGEAAERATAARLDGLASRANVGLICATLGENVRLSGVVDRIEREIAKLEELGDAVGLAEAYREAAKLESWLGRSERADSLFAHALSNARLSGSGRIEADVVLWRLASQCWGYLPAGAGVREANNVLEQRTGGMAEAFALIVRGRYRALQGDLTAGRADIEAGRALIRDFGAVHYVAGSGQEQAQCELEAGQWTVAEAVLRDTYELFTKQGIASPTAVVMLAQALVEQGRLDEAERFARITEEMAAPDDIGEQILWRSARARILARRGDLVGGEALARGAVELGEQSDYLESNANALLALAEVLAAAGRVGEARPAIEEAIRVYERKESVVGGERARARLRDLTREPLPERE